MTIDYKIKLVRAITLAVVSFTLYVWAVVTGSH
jgi:hypothetical protein